MAVLFDVTPSIGLKKVLDGQKPWGNIARENLDLLDAYINQLTNAGTINVTLNSSNVVPNQGTGDASLYGYTGTNVSLQMLSYSPSDRGFWVIGGSDTKGYSDGNEVVIRLSWTSSYTTGQTRWKVELASIGDNGTIDPVFSEGRLFDISSCNVNPYGLTTVEMTFVPLSSEIQQGKPTIVKISRVSDSDTGGVVGNDVLLFGVDVTYNLPEITFQQIFNIFEGSSQDTSNIDFTYNSDGFVDTAVETLIDGSTVRTFSFTYNDNDYIDTIVMTTSTHVYTEVYTYDVDGNILNISTTFQEV